MPLRAATVPVSDVPAAGQHVCGLKCGQPAIKVDGELHAGSRPVPVPASQIHLRGVGLRSDHHRSRSGRSSGIVERQSNCPLAQSSACLLPTAALRRRQESEPPPRSLFVNVRTSRGDSRKVKASERFHSAFTGHTRPLAGRLSGTVAPRNTVRLFLLEKRSVLFESRFVFLPVDGEGEFVGNRAIAFGLPFSASHAGIGVFQIEGFGNF